MNARTLVVDIRDYWISGTGRGGVRDAATRVDQQGLPFLPGRHLRGLVRDAAETLAAFRGAQVEEVARLFGSGGMDAEGLLEFRDARLPPALASRLSSADGAPLRAALFEELHVTAVDETLGVAQDRTLRDLRVAVPMTLRGEIAWREDVPAEAADLAHCWADLIAGALPLVLAVGAHRHRGLGRARLSLEP